MNADIYFIIGGVVGAFLLIFCQRSPIKNNKFLTSIMIQFINMVMIFYAVFIIDEETVIMYDYIGGGLFILSLIFMNYREFQLYLNTL
jgi:hypothetical protein